MKKILSLVFSILFFSSAQANRNIDLAVSVAYPNHNYSTSYEVESFRGVYVDVIVKNVGKLTLQSQDQLFFGFELDGNVMSFTEKIVTVYPPIYEPHSIYYNTGVTLAPGDTFHIKKILQFGFPESQNGYHSFCFFALPDTTTATFIDGNRNNNVSCVNLLLYGGWPTSVNTLTDNNGTIDLNPNPAKDEAGTMVNLTEKDNVSMMLLDLSGRVVVRKDFGVVNAGENLLTIPVNNVPQGFYISQLHVGNRIYSGKLLVSHE